MGKSSPTCEREMLSRDLKFILEFSSANDFKCLLRKVMTSMTSPLVRRAETKEQEVTPDT